MKSSAVAEFVPPSFRLPGEKNSCLGSKLDQRAINIVRGKREDRFAAQMLRKTILESARFIERARAQDSPRGLIPRSYGNEKARASTFEIRLEECWKRAGSRHRGFARNMDEHTISSGLYAFNAGAASSAVMT